MPITPDRRLGLKVDENGTTPVVDSIYRLIIVASLRSKQLQRGSEPRIVADPKRRKNTSIALEEIRQGLVQFHSFPVAEPNGLGDPIG
jgi:DNA-directed RNA polymerase omega subunit